RVGESIADVSAGVFAAFGISSALFHRQTTGEGAHIDIPMLDVMLAMQPTNASLHAAGSTPTRVGNRHPVSAPSPTYRAADAPVTAGPLRPLLGHLHPPSAPVAPYRPAAGLVVIAVANDRLFGVLAETLGKPNLATNPRFATDAQRSANDEALRVEIEQFTTRRDVEELCTIFDAAGVPNSPVLDYAEALDGPIGAGRNLTASDGRTGHAYLGHPLLVDGVRPASTLPAPRLGEHNADFGPATEN